MKTGLYIGLLLLAGCRTPRPLATTTSPLLTRGCYYYYRPGRGGGSASGPFTERINPFWYQAVGRAGRNVLMDVYAPDGYTVRLRQNEKRLTQYSVGVSCSVIDSLKRIYRPLSSRKPG